jgi:hypothetical protein
MERQPNSNFIVKCIDSVYREVQTQKATKIASILNSKSLPVENPEKYQVLRQYGVPLDDLRIAGLIKDLHTLNTDLPAEIDIFSLGSWNNRERKILSVPRSESLSRFEANMRDVRFVDELLLASIPLPDDKTRGGENDECEKQVDVDDAAMWFVKAIGQQYPELFVSAASKLGFSVHAKQMPPERVAAMMQYAAINQVRATTKDQSLHDLPSFL